MKNIWNKFKVHILLVMGATLLAGFGDRLVDWVFYSYDHKGEDEAVAADYVYDYCDTMEATPVNVVTDEMPMLYVDYHKILRLLPSPYNSYELRGYVGNESGIIIGNSQTNAHGPDIWGPTYYADGYEKRQFTTFKGNGFHIPVHLPSGNYTYVMQFIFHTEYGDMNCTKILPFKIQR